MSEMPYYDPVTNHTYQPDDPFNPVNNQPAPGVNPINDAGNSVMSWIKDQKYNFETSVKNLFSPSNWQDKIKSGLGLDINSASSQGKISYTKTGIPYDSSNIDSQINALAQEYAYKRDDESYDRLVAALKRNGMNPALVLGNSASPMSSDTAYRSNYNMTTKDQINSALKAGSILALILGLMLKAG